MCASALVTASLSEGRSIGSIISAATEKVSNDIPTSSTHSVSRWHLL